MHVCALVKIYRSLRPKSGVAAVRVLRIADKPEITQHIKSRHICQQMIKHVHTQILRKTVDGQVCHQLLWSHLEITIKLVFVIVPLDTKIGKGVKASAAANSFFEIGTPAVSANTDSLLEMQLCLACGVLIA